jgi:Na+/proline symporter
MYGADQVSVQRYLAAKSLKGMQKSFILNTVGGWSLGFLMIGIGLGLYAFYALHPGRLPATIGGDKVFPYFIATEMPPGLRGLMIAAILAAAMSSIDSGLNSSVTALITDFFKRFGWLRKGSQASAEQEARRELSISRALTLFLGIVVTVLACFVGALGTIIEIANKLVNSFAGPMLGIFVLGMMTRKTEWIGAFWGLLVGTVVTGYCIIDNRVSFLWFGPIGMAATVLVGMAVSSLLGSQETTRSDLVFRFWRSQGEATSAESTEV